MSKFRYASACWGSKTRENYVNERYSVGEGMEGWRERESRGREGEREYGEGWTERSTGEEHCSLCVSYVCQILTCIRLLLVAWICLITPQLDVCVVLFLLSL